MATTRKRTTPRKKRESAVVTHDHSLIEVDPERHVKIAEAAYYRAEKRGFEPGLEDQDWFEAEREIDAVLGRTVVR